MYEPIFDEFTAPEDDKGMFLREGDEAEGDQDEFDEWVEENFDEGDRFFLIPEYRGR